jgi:hypothetical protein
MQGQVTSPRMAPFETVRIGIGSEDFEAVGLWLTELGDDVGRERCELRIYRSTSGV